MVSKIAKKKVKEPQFEDDDLLGSDDDAPASSRKVKRSDNLDGGTEASKKLRSIIQRIERLMQDRDAVNEDIKDVYAEAKASGLDTKVLRAVISRRRKEAEEVREFEELLDLYLAQLGYE